MTSSPPVFLQGRLIYLRSATAEDFGEPMLRWINDKEVTRHLFRGTFPANAEELKEEFRQLTANRSEIVLAVAENETNTYLGVAGLHSVNWVARHAEFRILLGEKSRWGKGCGTEAAQLLVAYGFKILNLNKVWLGVNASNQRAVDSYRKAGFVEEGTLRDEVYRNGNYHSVIRMSILRTEYDGVSKTWPTLKLIAAQFPE